MTFLVKYVRLVLFSLLVGATTTMVGAVPSFAQGSGRLVAIVNDEAISEYDLGQRVKMNKTLGSAGGSKQQQRQLALSQLIDNILKRQEATRLNLGVAEAEVEESYKGMATRAGISQEAWAARLKKNGVVIKTIKKEVESSLSWRRVVRARFGQRIQVENADVDREYQKILQNPPKSQTRYVLRRILLPLQKNAPAALLNTRLGEGQRIIKRFKGCGQIKKAISGIFNVRILRAQTVPREAIPNDLRKVLDRVGPGRAVGPGPSPQGVVVIAYCNRKKIEAPVITREAVEQQLLFRKFDRIGQQFLTDLKRDAIIEYKDLGLRS